jgi:hypothetical protein
VFLFLRVEGELGSEMRYVAVEREEVTSNVSFHSERSPEVLRTIEDSENRTPADMSSANASEAFSV